MPSHDLTTTKVLVRLALCAALPVATWLLPAPDGLTEGGWHVFGFFAGTILSFLIQPFPMGAMVMLALVALAAYFASLCACLTNYSTGSVIIYYGQGYVPATNWFRVGFIMSLAHMAMWLGLGMAWWKLLGWW